MAIREYGATVTPDSEDPHKADIEQQPDPLDLYEDDTITWSLSGFPSGAASKAIQRPSGDQQGDPAFTPAKDVSCTGPRPSRSHTQTSGLPDRSDSKAIRSPSGEI